MQLQSKGAEFILRYQGYSLQQDRERFAHKCLPCGRNLGGTAEVDLSFVPEIGMKDFLLRHPLRIIDMEM